MVEPSPSAASTRTRVPASLLGMAIAIVLMLITASCAGGDDDSTTTTTPQSAGAGTTAPQSTSTQVTTSDTAASGSTPSSEAGADSEAGAGTVPAGCTDRAAGATTFITSAGGPDVEVRVYIPDGADDAPLPVVLNWHGLGSDGSQQALLSAYESLADTEGFIAVHPTGASAAGDTRNSWELAQFDVPGRDDLAMVDDVIDQLVTGSCADPTRIYSTGLSNGGFFTALLICERADRIAAATSVAGVSHPDGCEPSRPVPFIAFHGTADEIVTFDGGRSALEAGPSTGASRAFFDQSMPEEFAEFAADFGCEAEPESTAVGTEVTRYDYVGCQAETPLSFYEIDDGGHTWPGSPLGPVLTAALGHTTDEVDATADGWAFMSQYSLPPETDG